jgi:hypothetical protein
MEAPSATFSASLFVRSFMKSHYTKCLGNAHLTGVRVYIETSI